MNIAIGIGIGIDYDSTMAEAGTTRYVFDDFNRANNPGNVGSAVTGQAWMPESGVWGILNNRLYVSAASPHDVLVIDSLQSDNIGVQCTFALNSNDQKVVFRYLDLDNYWFVKRFGTNYELYKREIGADTLIGSSFMITPANGDIIRVEMIGDLIIIQLNGNTIMATNGGFNQTATIHGLGCTNNTTPQWDDFIVESL